MRADTQGGKRLTRLPGAEFVRRFLLHVLPTGAKRIRHYGVLASACKADKLQAARAALQLPAVNPQATESAKDFMARVAQIDVLLCPCCQAGRLHVVQVLWWDTSGCLRHSEAWPAWPLQVGGRHEARSGWVHARVGGALAKVSGVVLRAAKAQGDDGPGRTHLRHRGAAD